MDQDIELLLAHADVATPVLPRGLKAESLPRDVTAVERPPPEHLASLSADPNILRDQRWGLIAPAGEVGDRLIEAIGPLRRIREEEQGCRAVERRVSSTMTWEEITSWRKTVLEPGHRFHTEVPLYVLILGDFDQVPLELQQALSDDSIVGRLAFTKLDDYRAYAEKVARWSAKSLLESHADSLFYVARDGTSATKAADESLLRPGLCLAREGRTLDQYPARAIREIPGGATELRAAAESAEGGVLFTASHGLGAPKGGWRTANDRERLQGALALPNGGQLAAEDLGDRPFLGGGVWFMLACFGAGTPATSVFRPWVERLARFGSDGMLRSVLESMPQPGDRPFVAALPRALLAAERGPLAIMSHVDLAWTYAFQDVEGDMTSRPVRFLSVLQSLLKGSRVGVAFRELVRFVLHVNQEIVLDLAKEAGGGGAPSNLLRRSHLWMLRQDLAGYVLLGDPAVRLPLAATPSAFGGFMDPSLYLPKSSQRPQVSSQALEEAIASLILGGRAAELAARLGIEARELERCAEVYREAGAAALRRNSRP